MFPKSIARMGVPFCIDSVFVTVFLLTVVSFNEISPDTTGFELPLNNNPALLSIPINSPCLVPLSTDKIVPFGNDLSNTKDFNCSVLRGEQI